MNSVACVWFFVCNNYRKDMKLEGIGGDTRGARMVRVGGRNGANTVLLFKSNHEINAFKKVLRIYDRDSEYDSE